MSEKGEIRDAFFSPNEFDRNGEVANVVYGLFAIARALDRVAKAITEFGALANIDADQR